MVPAAGIQSAFADEVAERPATTGGDAALEGYSAESVPVATQCEDGMYLADGLVYTVTDGGLSLVGFDGLPEGEDVLKEIVVPEAVSVDGKDIAVMSVAIAEGNVTESVVSLTLPQSVNNVNTATLAAAFPNLASVEIAVPKASAPVAAGAAAMKAAYSSFGGILYKNNLVASESDASQTTFTKELVWAPPAAVVARIPVECTSIAAGAFVGVKDLKTVVCFGVMEDVPQAQKAEDGTIIPGAFTDEQIQTANVIVPQTGTVVSDGDRVSANVAVTDDSTMDVKREAWWKSGFASDRITLGEVYGSTTNTLPVTEEGTLEAAEAEVAYAPETTQNSSSRKAGIEPPESAIPTPVPDDDQLDSSASGLAFTHLADMTLSVAWKGDPTATPSRIDIPAYVTINGVTYPVTEIAPNAFKGAVFLTSVTIPEGVTVIGDSAFADCANLADASFPSTLKTVASNVFDGIAVPAFAQDVFAASTGTDEPQQGAMLTAVDPKSGDGELDYLNDSISSYASLPGNGSTSRVFVRVAHPSGTSIITITPESNTSASGDTVTCSSSFDFVSARISSHVAPGQWLVQLYKSYTSQGTFYISATAGWYIAGVQVGAISDDFYLTCTIVRDEIVGTSELATVTYASDAAKLTTGTLSSARIADKSITTAKLADLNVTSGKLAANAVTADKITDSNVTTNKVADLAVTTSKLATDAVTGAKIQDGAVAAADLAANAVETAKIKDGAVTSDKIADGTIAAADLANGSVTTDKLWANAVTSAKIADGTITMADLANGSVTDDKLAVKFGTISYSGLDGADASVYPTTYRQGGTPALPAPRKAGSEFLGWTWSGQDAPTTDASVIKGAFAGSGAVALTANWKAASTGYFFSTDAPFDKDAGEQSFTLAVRLSDSAGTLSSVSFENDNDALFPDGAGVAFAIGNALGGDGTLASAQMTASGFSSATGSSVQLAQLGDQSWGVYVKVTVSGDAAGEVTKSFADGSYVAKFVKLNYGLS